MAKDKGPKATAVIFPFDLFGSPGAGAGAALVADELREVLADNRRERVPTRAAAYTDRLRRSDYVGHYYRAALPAEALAVDPLPALGRLREARRRARRVFLDIDCD